MKIIVGLPKELRDAILQSWDWTVGTYGLNVLPEEIIPTIGLCYATSVEEMINNHLLHEISDLDYIDYYSRDHVRLYINELLSSSIGRNAVYALDDVYGSVNGCNRAFSEASWECGLDDNISNTDRLIAGVDNIIVNALEQHVLLDYCSPLQRSIRRSRVDVDSVETVLDRGLVKVWG